MIAAGGWTETQDGWNEISHTAVWYDPTSASWVQIENLKKHFGCTMHRLSSAKEAARTRHLQPGYTGR